jgi:hypothetical protein
MPDREGSVPVNRLELIARAIYNHQQVAELVRDPDPEPTHLYERSPHSGAGNCVCGDEEHHRSHPHRLLPADSDRSRCVCGLPLGARCHLGSYDA